MKTIDVIIVGAGAAGLMCAIEAGKRGRTVLLLDHNAEIGEKIRISGGGRCNFTNRTVHSNNFISQNPHFSKSALARFTPADFIAMIERYHINYHERNHGQLFCNGSAKEIIQMLLEECTLYNISLKTNFHCKQITKIDTGFKIPSDGEEFTCTSLVIATGGLSIPTLGASSFGLEVAKQFDIDSIPPKPGLVPLKFDGTDLTIYNSLSGIAIDVEITCNNISFRENILFTHRGISGPAVLQISSYWNEGDVLQVNLLPLIDILGILEDSSNAKKQLVTVLEQFLPSRFCQIWLDQHGGSKTIHQHTPIEKKKIADSLANWYITPIGTEGYAKAEVTVGGVNTNELSSKTMESKKVPGLYFIGEVVDVTGWLGGYNFQWAWSSGWAAGQVV